MQRYFKLFGQRLSGSNLHQWCGVYANNSNFHGTVNIRCFSQALENNENTYGRSKKKEFNISDLIQHINKGRVFYLKQLTNVFHTIEFDQLKTDEAVLLLRHCGSVVADSSREKRNTVCQDIYKRLQEVNNVDSNIFNQYIKTCTENSILIYNKALLLKYKPDKDTYKLLLENVCQFGKVKDTFEILELMKDNDISLDSDSINNLILAYTIEGGLKSGEAVLKTIRTAHISESSSAKLALFKGLIRRKDLREFKKAKEDFPLSLTEYEFLDFIQELGLNGQESWLEEVPDFYKHIDLTRDLQIKIEKICIHLIHMGQPFSAMNLYKNFVVPHPVYGLKLLKEMLHCNIDISNIISMAKNLVDTGLNPHILENLTELALRFKYEEQAWRLLGSLEVVRPHYFRPLLIQNAISNGEYGIFTVLKRIKEFQVKLDSETLEEYVLPYCDLTDSKLLMMKLQDVGFSIREILSPFLVVLMKNRKTKKASELCRLYNVKISGENFVQHLAKCWIFTKDSTSIFALLSRYCESNPLEQDTVGAFLIHIARSCKQEEDFHAYLNLLQVIGKNRLRISIHTADVIREIFADKNLQKQLEVTLHPLVDLGLNIADDAVIAHPRSMNLDGLENHLIELQEKNMETRGVLRRLIQMHANKGNLERVKELRQLFLERGYEESPGMKSAIMHSYVSGNHADEAMNLYGELKAFHPEFHLDPFKFIDLVKVLIDNNRFDEGVNILKDEISNCKKVKSKQSIERNCKNLLSVCKNAEQLDTIFNLLFENELCVISNVLLGPLVRIHLKSGDIDKAVERFIEISRKHKCTPLQFEVLSTVAERQDADQLQRVVKATEAVHGAAQTQVGLIAALAENGQGNALRKTLINVTSPIQGLLKKRCTRWIEERKLEPLKCLASACAKLPQEFADVDFINRCILEIYDLNGDLSGALEFFKNLPEDSRSITLEQELQMLRDKQSINRFGMNITNTV